MGGRVLRVITRLTVSGPSTHVLLLDRGLARQGWETLLVYGSVEEGETEMDLSAVDVPARAPRAAAAVDPARADDARALARWRASCARTGRTSSTPTSRRPGSSAGWPGR